ncbi:unnamed protein product [Prorocentrum cordatum]|uniref:Uncharacterized protein n=1 Tax=Prorocentrum cordatum TaxID=2364126 RepID=A0ABN9SWZ9_9DINO|nr:unnamed protein product [Polarella glacialis]
MLGRLADVKLGDTGARQFMGQPLHSSAGAYRGSVAAANTESLICSIRARALSATDLAGAGRLPPPQPPCRQSEHLRWAKQVREQQGASSGGPQPPPRVPAPRALPAGGQILLR